MIPKSGAAISQHTTELWVLPTTSPRLVFARDDSRGGRAEPDGQRRVLIVEDDFLIASDAELALREAGFEVVGVAITADEVIEIVADRQPALVIMDIPLIGRRDGIEVALEIFRKYGLRCIFATAHMDAETQRRAAPAQPLAWLPKPYTSAALVALVEKVWD